MSHAHLERGWRGIKHCDLGGVLAGQCHHSTLHASINGEGPSEGSEDRLSKGKSSILPISATIPFHCQGPSSWWIAYSQGFESHIKWCPHLKPTEAPLCPQHHSTHSKNIWTTQASLASANKTGHLSPFLLVLEERHCLFFFFSPRSVSSSYKQTDGWLWKLCLCVIHSLGESWGPVYTVHTSNFSGSHRGNTCIRGLCGIEELTKSSSAVHGCVYGFNAACVGIKAAKRVHYACLDSGDPLPWNSIHADLFFDLLCKWTIMKRSPIQMRAGAQRWKIRSLIILWLSPSLSFFPYPVSHSPSFLDRQPVDWKVSFFLTAPDWCAASFF